MAHYIVSVAGLPEANADGARLQLSVTSDDAAHARIAWVHVSGGEPSHGGWRALVTYAVEQLEFGFRGQNWGVEIEDLEPLLIEVSAATVAHLTDEETSGAALDVGDAVGDFEL